MVVVVEMNEEEVAREGISTTAEKNASIDYGGRCCPTRSIQQSVNILCNQSTLLNLEIL